MKYLDLRNKSTWKVGSSILLAMLTGVFTTSNVAFAQTAVEDPAFIGSTSNRTYNSWGNYTNGTFGATEPSNSAVYISGDECGGSEQGTYFEGSSGQKQSFVLDLSDVPTNATITEIDLIPCGRAKYPGSLFPAQFKFFYRWDQGGSDPAHTVQNTTEYFLNNSSSTGLLGTTFNAIDLERTTLGDKLEIGVNKTSDLNGVMLKNIKTILYYE